VSVAKPREQGIALPPAWLGLTACDSGGIAKIAKIAVIAKIEKQLQILHVLKGCRF